MNGRALNLLILVAALALLGGLGVRWLQQSDQQVRGAPDHAPVESLAPSKPMDTFKAASENRREVVTEKGARVVFKGGDDEESGTATAVGASPAPLNTLPPSELVSTDVANYTRRNGLDVLVLRDGSELMVNDYVYRQLPESIRYRLNYQRGTGE